MIYNKATIKSNKETIFSESFHTRMLETAAKMFPELDSNGDGKISREELRSDLRSSFYNSTEAKIEGFISEKDRLFLSKRKHNYRTSVRTWLNPFLAFFS